MARIDSWIGGETALRAVAGTDALRDAGEPGGEGRPDRAVEDPHGAKARAAQQRGEPREVKAARKFRAAMLEIDDIGDARLTLQQLLRVGRGQGEECAPAP